MTRNKLLLLYQCQWDCWLIVCHQSQTLNSVYYFSGIVLIECEWERMNERKKKSFQIFLYNFFRLLFLLHSSLYILTLFCDACTFMYLCICIIMYDATHSLLDHTSYNVQIAKAERNWKLQKQVNSAQCTNIERDLKTFFILYPVAVVSDCGFTLLDFTFYHQNGRDFCCWCFFLLFTLVYLSNAALRQEE